jgi:hypothetical protein
VFCGGLVATKEPEAFFYQTQLMNFFLVIAFYVMLLLFLNFLVLLLLSSQLLIFFKHFIHVVILQKVFYFNLFLFYVLCYSSVLSSMVK